MWTTPLGNIGKKRPTHGQKWKTPWSILFRMSNLNCFRDRKNCGHKWGKHSKYMGRKLKSAGGIQCMQQYAQDLGKNIEVQARNPAPPTPPPPQPVNPSPVASRSRRQAALDRGIAAVEAAQLNLNPFSKSLVGLQSHQQKRIQRSESPPFKNVSRVPISGKTKLK